MASATCSALCRLAEDMPAVRVQTFRRIGMAAEGDAAVGPHQDRRAGMHRPIGGGRSAIQIRECARVVGLRQGRSCFLSIDLRSKLQ